MSAIWGAIDLNGGKIPEVVKSTLRKAYDGCVIDRYEEKSCDNVYMGCGIQYFTDEAVQEPLPIMGNHACFTADVVLDNREELAESMGISSLKELPDGKLLYQVYSARGNDSLNDLLGAYSFVWYHKEKKKAELVSDAVGNRCLYYYFRDGMLYFSTLLLPLARLSGKGLNDRWMTDFLAMDYLQMINEAEETPYQGIYRIAPAQHVAVTRDGTVKQQYWNPHKAGKKQRKISDAACKEQFRKLWDKVVKSHIRTSSDTSILLSGGLDSTAVAAVAAPYLKSQGKQLYSYTSVPAKGYKAKTSGYHIEDESGDVLQTAAFYGNIVPEFIDLDGKNAWDLHKAEMEGLEMPYKSVQNLLWIAESMRKAYARNSRLMLYGSYGNTSISYSDMSVYMNRLLTGRKYLTLWKELTLFSRNMGFQKKRALRQILIDYHAKAPENPYPYRNSFVDRAYADALGARKRLDQSMLDGQNTEAPRTGYRDDVFLLPALRQIGEIATKHTLMTGVLLRDPTKDKRVLEFCASLPYEYYCRRGTDRRMVKDYLRPIMPEHVMGFSRQGMQSADVQFRIAENWERIRGEWLDLLERYRCSKYVDTSHAARQLLEMPDIAQYSNYDITRYIYTMMVLEFEAAQYPEGTPDALPRPAKEEASEEPLISVIVPVYNTKTYLQKCVDSILSQTYTHLEILLVDDGSTDGSGALCDSLAESDPRIQVIHQENRGVSAARNTALDAAQGDYIGFVDSDDWIDMEMYAKLWELLSENHADIACCLYRRVSDAKTTDQSDGRVRLYDADQMLDTMFTGHDNCFLTPAIWNRLYRRSLFDNVRFPDLQKYEDKVVNVCLLQSAGKAVFLNKAYYNYVYRTNSLTAAEANTYEFMSDCIRSNRMIQDTLRKKLCRASMRELSFYHFCNILDKYCSACRKGTDTRLIRLLKKELLQLSGRELRATILQRNIRKKDRLSLLVSTYSPRLYYLTLLES